MPRLTIFLDDGGVLSDNDRRAPEWQRLVGHFFAPRLGSTPQAWAEANRLLVGGIWERALLEQARLGLVDTYHAWSRYYQTSWLRTMAAHVGAGLPPNEDEVFELAVEAARFVTHNCRSAFEDAPAAVEALVGAGFALNTASGGESSDLNGYLTGMGVREAFTHLFGPDLVNAFKSTPVYYQRAFERAGVDPQLCVVVDDSPKALAWAGQAGALTVLMDRTGATTDGYEGHSISNLQQLLPFLETLQAS